MDVRAEIHALTRRIGDLEDMLLIKVKVDSVRRAMVRSEEIERAFNELCSKYDIPPKIVQSSRGNKGQSQKKMLIAKELCQAGCNKSEVGIMMHKDPSYICYLDKLPINHYDLVKA